MVNSDLAEQFKEKIKILNETAWERRAMEPAVDRWLDNFHIPGRNPAKDQIHALHLLSHFMYFGDRELRMLLKVLYQDLFRYPIIQQLREANGSTIDADQIKRLFDDELKHTRFLGVGNPSESGVHLLYYFRQEIGLPKHRFIHTHEMFSRSARFPRWAKWLKPRVNLRDPNIRHYVFIDDLCGSGNQAGRYSRELLDDIKALGAKAQLHYYVLFATSEGMRAVRRATKFDRCECVFDSSSTVPFSN